MNVKLLSVLCFLLLTGLVSGAAVGRDDDNEAIKDEDEDIYGDLGDSDTPKDEARGEDYYDETDDDKKIGQSTLNNDNDIDVKLVSKPEHLGKHIGDLIRLPCQVDDKKADVIRTWYRNGQVLYQGQALVNKIDNIRLNGSSLEVKIVDDADYGEYNCTLFLREHMNPNVVHTVYRPMAPKIVQLETSTNSTQPKLADYGEYNCNLYLREYMKPNVVHTVYRPMAPKIVQLETSTNITQFREGDTVTLICRASGIPRPKIVWFRHNEKLATGEQLSFDRVNGKEDGTYRCLADNKEGAPAHGHISIHVQRKPSIEVEKLFINSDHRHQAELICHVDAEPKAAVNWKKNGDIIPDDVAKYGRPSEGKKNVLLIKNVQESDFGVYSCHARNVYGEDEKSVNLVKLPVVQEFHKSTNISSKDVILTWKVESKQAISQHQLQYRKKGEETWKTISPQVSDPQNDVYLIQETLQGLEPGTYETRARSRNDHGWSNYSDIMPFDEAKRGSQHQRKHHKNKDKNEKDQSQKPTQTIQETHVGANTLSAGTWCPVSSLAVLISASFLSIFVQHRP